MKKVNIGLDIGIASVGWAIMDENNKILLHGVRLFDTVDDPKDSKLLNENRREKRSLRRRIWRTATRKRDLIKFFIGQGLFKTSFPFDVNNQDDLRKKDENKDIKFVKDFREYICFKEGETFDIYSVRKKIIENKIDLSNKDLLRVLYWYSRHRGFSHEDVEEKKDETSIDLFGKVKEYLKEKNNKEPFIAEIQYEILNNPLFLPEQSKNITKIRETIGKFFSRKEYKREIETILSNLGFNKEFFEKYLEIVHRQRSFELGPGSEKIASKYGVWNEVVNDNGEKIIQASYSSIWEKTVKRCAYTNEPTISKNALSFYIYSLLNYLNNLSYGDDKLNEKEKTNLILSIFEINKENTWPKNWSNVTNKKIVKAFKNQFGNEVEEMNIEGWVVEKKEKKVEDIVVKPIENLLKINQFSSINKIFTENNFVLKKHLNIFSFVDIFDEIAYILQKSTLKSKRLELLLLSEIKNKMDIFDYLGSNKEEDIKNIYDKLSNLKGFSQTGNLSRTIILEANKYMIKNSANFNQFINETGLYRSTNDYNFKKYKGIKRLTTQWIKKAPVSPTVKRSFTQSVKILNAIFDLCIKNQWSVHDIAIETARENNNKQQKEIIEGINKVNEERKKKFKEELKSKGISHPSPSLLLKLLLWDEQKGLDLYDAEKIDKNDLLDRPYLFEVDHIIPWSLSFDNSFSNKVITKKYHNQNKSNLTSYQYLSTNREKFQELKRIWEEKLPKNRVGKQKLDNLKNPIDFSKEKFKTTFIGRNINDTRSSIKLIIDILENFKEKSKKDENANFKDLKVKIITGSFTSFLRKLISQNHLKNKEKYAKLINPVEKYMTLDEKRDLNKKNRIWHGHHAQDAVLTIYSVQNPRYSKIIEKEYNENDKHKFIKILEKDYFDSDLNKLVIEMNLKRSEMRFSKKINFLSNTSLHNETVYKAKEIDKTIYQVNSKEITKIENSDYNKYFNENSKEFLGHNIYLFSHNKQLWQKLKEIFEIYKEENLPFKKAIDVQNSLNNNFINQSSNPQLIIKYENKGKIVVNKVSKIRTLAKDAKSQLKMVKFKNNSNSFFSSLNWLWIDIYSFVEKNKEKKIIVPANTLNVNIFQREKDVKKYDFSNENNYDIFGDLPKISHNKKIQYKKEYYDHLEKLCKITEKNKNTFFDFKHVHRIFKNSVLIKPESADFIDEEFDDMFYISSHNFDQFKLEIKRLKTNNLEKDKRQQATINTSLKNWFFVDVDILGNIYNKKEIK